MGRVATEEGPQNAPINGWSRATQPIITELFEFSPAAFIVILHEYRILPHSPPLLGRVQ